MNIQFNFLQVAFCLFGFALCSMENIYFDVNDILSESFMPTSFLMLDSSTRTASNHTNDEKCATESVKYDGKWQNAYSTMGFHRKMITKYMCNNFLVRQIMKDVAPAGFRHKVGEAASEGMLRPFEVHDEKVRRTGGRSMKNDAQDNMLHDQGSSSYKKWLEKYFESRIVLNFEFSNAI